MFPIFIRKGEEGIGLLEVTKLLLGKTNGPFEEQMGSMMVYDKVCLGVRSTDFWFLSCDKSQFSLVEKLPGKGLMTTEFLLEDLYLGRQVKIREVLALHLLFGKCLQLNVINIPKCCIWELHVLHLSHAS